MSLMRSPMLWGVVSLLLAVVSAVAAAVVYVSPPGHKSVVFYTDDASSLRSGDDVRMAGISVGKVERLTLETNQIRVQAEVDRGTFIGDQSQVQVRMLTVVGGYYVSVVSLGSKDLGNRPIPVDRVKMPYNLMRTLADTTKVSEQMNAKPIRESLDRVQAGLQGPNLDTVTAAVDAGNSLVSTIDRQRGQISQILGLSDEYIEALNNYRGKLAELVSKVSIIEQTLVLYSKGFAQSLKNLGDVADAILVPYGNFWVNHREDFIERIREWEDRIREWADHNSRIVPRLRRVRDKIERVLDAQNARPELLATDVCIPVEGSPC